MTDIEVGRFALRTFALFSDASDASGAQMGHHYCNGYYATGRGPFTLCSVTMAGANWVEGACRAECKKVEYKHNHPTLPLPLLGLMGSRPNPHKGGVVPDEYCQCGVYGTLTLEHLVAQYPLNAACMVAVIALEGQTLMGDKGVRTEYARVVAYWVNDETYAGVCQGLDAQGMDLGPMLAAYGFPPDPLLVHTLKSKQKRKRMIW